MAEQFFTDIEIDVGDDVIQKINDKLSSHTFEINAELSSDSINNIESSLSDISIGADLDLSGIETEIENISGAIGGTIEGMSDGLDEINDKLLDMATNIGEASSETERQARAKNLDMSNDLVNKMLATGAGVIGAGTGISAIGQAGDTAISLQQVHERTQIDYDVIGRFVSGLTTGRELLDPKVALNMGEQIANKITDLVTGKSPEGVEALRVLGLDVGSTREEVLEKIMGLSDKDFNKFTPEINRTFEQILGVNFNALKGADFSENLFADGQTALSIRESKREFIEELTILTQNLSGANVIFYNILEGLSGIGNWLYGGLKGSFEGAINTFDNFNKPKSAVDIRNEKIDNAINGFEGSYLANRINQSYPITVSNTNDIISRTNNEISDIISMRGQDRGIRQSTDLSGLSEIVGEDLKLQKSELTNETLKEIVTEIRNLYREMAKSKITVLNQSSDIQSNILKE